MSTLVGGGGCMFCRAGDYGQAVAGPSEFIGHVYYLQQNETPNYSNAALATNLIIRTSAWRRWCIDSCAVCHLTTRLIHLYFLRRSGSARYVSTDPTRRSWALITGASDGIGRGFAYELCTRGMNVILHGRNEAKLQRVKTNLLECFPGRGIEIAVVDAARYDDNEALSDLAQYVCNLPGGGRLRVLVNNVGGGNPLIGQGVYHRLVDTTLDEVDTLINVNARFPARLTMALLPALTDADNSPTLILNIGSVAGIASLPYTIVYNATKAFNLSFSSSLAAELKAEGYDVEVLGFVVGSVDTPGASKDDQDSLLPLCIGPQDMAKSALDTVGCDRRILSPNWKHWVQGSLLSIVPRPFIMSKIRQTYEAEKKAK